MDAYDYTRQVWVDGEEGRVLLAEQARETLQLLLSERGADYCQMMGTDLTAEIASARAFLAQVTA